MINDFIEAGQEEIHLIVFRLGSEEYAVPITSVQEIIMIQLPTRIPKAPPFVEGVINLRGHIIPIIDGRKKFQLDVTALTNESRIMIIELTNETIGLIVDAVSEVVHLNAKDIEPPPIDVTEDSDFLWGVGKFVDRLLILVDPQKFLNFSETANLKTLAKASKIKKENVELKADIKKTNPSVNENNAQSIDETLPSVEEVAPKNKKKQDKRKTNG